MMKVKLQGHLAPMIDADIELFGMQRAHGMMQRNKFLHGDAATELLRLVHSEGCWLAPLSAPYLQYDETTYTVEIFSVGLASWSRLKPVLLEWSEAFGLSAEVVWHSSNCAAYATLPATEMLKSLTSASTESGKEITRCTFAENLSSCTFRAAVSADCSRWARSGDSAQAGDKCKPAQWLAALQCPQSTQEIQAILEEHLLVLCSQSWATQWALDACGACAAVGCPLSAVFVLHSLPPPEQASSSSIPTASLHLYRQSSDLQWPCDLALKVAVPPPSHPGPQLPQPQPQPQPIQGAGDLHTEQEPDATGVLFQGGATPAAVVDASGLSLLLLGTVLWGTADAPCTHVWATLIQPVSKLQQQLHAASAAAAVSTGSGWQLASILQALLLAKVGMSLLGAGKVGSADRAISVWLLLGMCMYSILVDGSVAAWLPFGCEASAECPCSVHSAAALHVAMVFVLLLTAWLHMLQGTLARLRRVLLSEHPGSNARSLSLRHAVQHCVLHLTASKRGLASLAVLLVGASSVRGEPSGLAAASCIACVLSVLASRDLPPA